MVVQYNYTAEIPGCDKVCNSGGHQWDCYSSAISLSKVTATHLKIGFPWNYLNYMSDLQMGCRCYYLTGYKDNITIVSLLWRHQCEWNTGTMCKDRRFLSSFMDSLCRVRNKVMYVLSWRTVSVPTRVLFLCLFPSLLRNSGNKHKITLVASQLGN